MATPIQWLIVSSSRSHHLVFGVCFFFFKQFTLEVLDLQNICEEYFRILHNQFPLLPLYISIKHLFNLVNPHWKSIIN